MSNFTEKVEEKLHLGGHKKDEGAHPQHIQDPAYAGVPPGKAGVATATPGGGHAGVPPGHAGVATAAPAGAYAQAQPHHDQGPLHKVEDKVKEGAHPQHVQDPAYAGVPAGHTGVATAPGHTGVAPAAPGGAYAQAQPHHDEPSTLDKVKNKVKGGKPKGEGGHSSSSSSESDGEGGRRKKKLGVF